VSQIPKSVSFL